MGKVSSATDEKGRKTVYDYDNFGNLVKISYPDGTTEAFTYDREGNNLTATDRLGRTVTMTYDKVGNLLSKTYPNGAEVTYSYDKNYNLVSETSASGGTTYYEYDRIGRNTAITDALGNKTEFSYNAKSQLESMTDAKGNVYTYSYDDNGNRIKTTYPDGSSVSSVYDARGRVTSQTDQHGYKTKYAYDGGDRLTSVTDALGNVTKYAYDEVGNMISVTDANGNVTRYSYDDFGRVVKTTNALENSAYTTYDESGNVLTSTDFGGNLTTYTYDDLDRVSSKTTPDGTVSYTYTADGKLSTVTDSTGTTSFTYNSMDGLTRVDYPDGNYVSYKYDKSNRLTKVSTAFGDTAYQYDALDRLTRVIDRNGYATVYEYDANGNRTAVKYANGLTVSYEYDKLNRLICEETVDSDSNVVVKYVYTLGASGERLSVTELDRTVEYTYDSLYRLTSETITKGKTVTTYAYEYDSVSNRTLKTVNGVETVYTYNSLNQLVSENNTTYEYDNAGNLVRVVGAGKTALYKYDSENRLIKATVQQGNNVVVETYTYDYAGNRTSKTTTINNHVEKVYYLNDNSSLTNVLVEYSANGDEICYYTIGADLLSQEIDGKVYAYLYDGHGTVHALANESGKLTDTYTYDAFGNLISSTGSTANSYRYCGEQFDSTTGLYYLRARYMDTNTGRFISQDTYAGSTADPISLHKYLYANSNPVMYSDPSGYMSLGEVTCVSAIIGGTCGAFINVAGYLDKLVGWRNFNLNDMLQTAFEGFMCGVTLGLLCGIGFAGLSYICVLFPSLSGLATAFTYAFGLWGASQSIITGYIEAREGNYYSALAFGILGWLSAFALFDSIFTSYSDVFAGNTNIGTINKGNSQPTSSSIHYSQNSISSKFKDGSSVDDMIQGLKTGEISIDDIPAIRIFKKDGVLYSLDNRRLYAFKQAGIENIPYRWATPEEIANESWKFTTENGGSSIQVRGK